MKLHRICLAVLAVVSLGFVGCGEKEQTVTISYTAPAEVKLPDNIKKVGVGDIVNNGKAEDKDFTGYATDKLYSELDNAVKSGGAKFTLRDQKAMKEMMGHNDLKDALSGGTAVTDQGVLADVQAVVYGTVRVNIKEDKERRDVGGGYYGAFNYGGDVRKMRVAVSVNFKMNNLSNGKTLATETYEEDFNCDNKDHKKRYGGKVPAGEKVANDIIDEAVRRFIAKVSTHKVEVTVPLAGGPSLVDANKFAVAGEYKDALEKYKAIIQANPSDHGALYNAGVCCEAMSNMDDAYKYYDRAVNASPNDNYIQARKRVRTENEKAANGEAK